jgi:hypothetical protein
MTILIWALLLFMAAQGGVIFLTARWVLHRRKIAHWTGKIAAMLISYMAWISFTIAAYILLGGEAGFMDGFGLVLTLCFGALISSFVYLLIWLLHPSPESPEEDIMIEPRM